MSEAIKEFPVYPDPPPGGFVEDPDFIYMDEEERELIESYERGEWRPMENREEVFKQLQEMARRTMEKRGISMSEEDEAADAPPRVAD